MLIFVFVASGIALAVLSQVQSYHREQIYLATESALPVHRAGQMDQRNQIDQNSVMEGWKTYRNEEYGFEFEYPVGWQRGDDKSFMRLGSSQSESMWIDAACIYGVGVEDPEIQIRSTQASVNFGENTFVEYKTYLKKGKEPERLAIHTFSLAFPPGYSDTHKYDNDPGYFKNFCKNLNLRIMFQSSQKDLEYILSTFKFIK